MGEAPSFLLREMNSLVLKMLITRYTQKNACGCNKTDPNNNNPYTRPVADLINNSFKAQSFVAIPWPPLQTFH